MSDVVIRVENLGKRYRIRHQKQGGMRYKALRDVLADKTKGVARRLWSAFRRPPTSAFRPPASEDFWALKDVSFEVRQGETLGIIGRNGAGKSTLLKILSRITEPTEGRVRIKGRVASLLEVGTGFHPELTGRENIFLNGAILGMTRAEIKKKFDEIVAFAEVEKFLDTPVKHYSSGMYVRLAFAVAAHLEPEILVVDEVLAVGDGQFQKKCLGKMGEVSRCGRTVLFVSHNMQAVAALCTKCLTIDHGRIAGFGLPGEAIAAYLQMNNAESICQMEQKWTEPSAAPGNNCIRLRRIAFIPESDPLESLLTIATPFRIEIDYWNLSVQESLVTNLFFFTIERAPVFETISTSDSNWHGQAVPPGLFRTTCRIPGNLFNEGSYVMKLRFFNSTAILYDNEEAAIFTVQEVAGREIAWFGKYIGPIRPQLAWETTELEVGTTGLDH